VKKTLLFSFASVQVFHIERAKQRASNILYFQCSHFFLLSAVISKQLGDIREETSVMSGVLALCLGKASGMKRVLFTAV
jgi:hypothetical protein